MTTKTKEIKAIPFVASPDKKLIRKDIEQNPEKFITELLTGSKFNFGVSDVMNNGVYKYMGYRYYLAPFLKRYVYKQYGSWHESYALNKANLRKLTYGRIDKIVEIN